MPHTEPSRAMNRQDRRVVIIGELPFFADSNQALRRTIEAYLEVGCEVVYITSASVQDVGMKDPRFRIVSVDRVYRGFARVLVPRARDQREKVTQTFPLSSSSIQPVTSVIEQVAKLVWFTALVAAPAYREARAANTRLVYGYEVFGAPIARLVGALTRTPSVGRFQGTVLHWAGACGAPLYSLGIRLGPRRVVMTNDGTYGDWVLVRRGRDLRRCLFIHNGVDPREKLHQHALPVGFRANTDVTWASRQVDWKRPDIAVEAWARYVQADHDAWMGAGAPRLWMFGDGPLTHETRRYAEALGVASQVEIVGSTDYLIVQRAIVESRCVLSTNDFSNITNTVLTAMYHRVPVVARDWGQLASLAPGVAWTVPPDESPAFSVADTLGRCLASRALPRPFLRGISWTERMAREVEFTLECSF